VGLPSDLIEQTLAGAMPAPDSCRPRVADAERLLEEMRQAAQDDLDDQALLALAAKVWRTDLYPE
jgi:hypothetical protein